MLNAVNKYQIFVDDVNDVLQRVRSTESKTLLGDFNAHMKHEKAIMIGRQGDPAFNENGRYLLQLRCRNGLGIMNTFFQHINDHKYTWC